MKKIGIDLSFKELTQHLNEPIVMTDHKGCFAWANDSFHRLCGYSCEEMIGQKPGKMLQGEQSDPGTVCAMRGAVEQGVGIQVEMVNYHKDNTPYWVSISITPIKSDRGQLQGFLAIEKETTQQHEQVASLEQHVVQVYNALMLQAEGHETLVQ